MPRIGLRSLMLGTAVVLVAAATIPASHLLTRFDESVPTTAGGSNCSDLTKPCVLSDVIENLILYPDKLASELESARSAPGDYSSPKLACSDISYYSCLPTDVDSVKVTIQVLPAFREIDPKSNSALPNGQSVAVGWITYADQGGRRPKHMEKLAPGDTAWWILTRRGKNFFLDGNDCEPNSSRHINSTFVTLKKDPATYLFKAFFASTVPEYFCLCHKHDQDEGHDHAGAAGRYHCPAFGGGLAKTLLYQVPPVWLRCKNGCCISQPK